MRIKLADLVLDLEIKENSKLSVFLERYSGFLTEEKPDFTIITEFIPLKKNPSQVKIRQGNIIQIERGDFSFFLKGKKGYLKLRPSIYSFDSFLRVFLSFLSAGKNAALVHGALAEKNKKFHAFLGKSGAGKSTVSRILKKEGFSILSDELFFVYAGKKNIKAYSSPFWGEMKGRGRQAGGKIKRFYFLKKSKINYIQKMSFSDFYPLFLRCLMNFSKDREIISSFSTTALSIFKKSSPSFLFFSKKDKSFVKLL